MKITQQLMDELTAEAKASPRLRMNRDLRNSPEDFLAKLLQNGNVLMRNRIVDSILVSCG